MRNENHHLNLCKFRLRFSGGQTKSCENGMNLSQTKGIVGDMMGKSALVVYKLERRTISVVGGLSDSKDGLKRFSTV